MIEGAREHEEQIGQAVHIREHLCVNLVRPERHNRPLCAPADGAREVQQRAALTSAGQNKPSKRRQLCFEAIDPLFKAENVGLRDSGFRDSSGNLFRRIRKSGADREQILLQLLDQLSYIAQLFAMGTDNAQTGVELIDIAVRRNARVGFRHTRAAEQGRPAGVARPRVNLHGRQYT